MENPNEKILAKFKQKKELEQRLIEHAKQAEIERAQAELQAMQQVADETMGAINEKTQRMVELLEQRDFPLEIGRTAVFRAIVVDGEEIATWRLRKTDDGKLSKNHVAFDGNVHVLYGERLSGGWDGREDGTWIKVYRAPQATMHSGWQGSYNERDLNELKALSDQLDSVIGELTTDTEE